MLTHTSNASTQLNVNGHVHSKEHMKNLKTLSRVSREERPLSRGSSVELTRDAPLLCANTRSARLHVGCNWLPGRQHQRPSLASATAAIEDRI